MMKRSGLFLLPFMYGFATLGFQILFVRRFIAIFGPSEIGYTLIITIWLLLTGIGAYVAERFNISRRTNFISLALFGLVSVVLYGSMPKIYEIWGLGTGEITGFITLAGTAMIALLPVCFFSGCLFVGIVKQVSLQKKDISLPFVYVVESVGALISGVLITLVCTISLEDRYIVLALFLLLVIVMMVRIDRHLLFAPARITAGIMCLFAGIAFALSQFCHQFGEQNILAHMDTPFQHLTATEYNSQITIYSDSHKMFSFKQKQEAEEVHLLLWQKEKFDNIAMVGLCPPDKIEEVLKYPEVRIDIYENDKRLLDFLNLNLPLQAYSMLNDKRVNYIWGDPFNEIAKRDSYDFIILNLENPIDGVSNRYFTIEFFSKIAQCLAEDGIFAFNIPGSENFLRENMKEYLQVLHKSLRVKFQMVTIIPGNSFLFLASNDSTAITLEKYRLLRSKAKNEIETYSVDSVYLSYLLDPLNLIKIEGVYSYESVTVNTISRPVVYYYNSVLRAERFSGIEKSILQFWKSNGTLLYVLLFLPLLILLILFRKSDSSIYYSIAFLAGFGGMSLEITILLLYQSSFGNIYSQIGLLIGLFMVGIALGGYLPMQLKKREVFRRLWLSLTSLTGGLIILGLILTGSGRGINLAGQLSIFVLALLSGGFSGFLFNFAARGYRNSYKRDHPGVFYLADLVGGSIAGVIVSILFVPLLGVSVIYLLFSIILLIYIILHGSLIKANI
jgi:spermidine synthase